MDEVLEVGPKLLELFIKLPDSILQVVKLEGGLQGCRTKNRTQ
jgi:hypothetical protein